MIRMKPEEEKIVDVGNNESVLKDGGSVSSINSVIIKKEEAQKTDEMEDKGTATKSDEKQNLFYLPKGDSPIPRSPSMGDNRSDTNTDILLRPKSTVVSAVVTPNRNLLGTKKSNSTADLQKYGQLRKPPTGKNKNENMVLQLVLPSTNRNSNNDTNYLTARSVDDILDNGHLKERNVRPHSVHTQQDLYLSPPNGAYLNRAYSACDLREYGHPGESPGAYSVSATPTSFQENEKPTPPEEKKRAFSGLLINVLSVFYALFNVTLGLAVYVSDLIEGTKHVAEIFSLILVSVAFLYILFLTVDIHLYMKKKRRYEKILEKNMADAIEMKETAEGHFQFNIALPEVVTLKRPLEHHYCFKKDRHSANFYLKIGAAVFCFGHLIHSGLIIGYQLVFLTNNESAFYECASAATLALDVLYPIYSFLLLFFIFKYSNVIINRYSKFARFGMMHCLSSSVCFWIWTIFREVLEALAFADYGDDDETTTTSPVTASDYVEPPYSLPLNYSNGQKGAQKEIVDISTRRFTAICEQNDESLSTIYRDFSPYLYPFSVEYSILVVGILYLVWQNIGACKEEEDADQTRQCMTPSGNKDNTESNVAIHADCHASNKGLFAGFTILVLTLVSIILFFIAIYTDDGRHGEIGVTLNIVTSLIILSFMTLACIFAFVQITKLDINSAHHNLLDDILLFICIPAYFLNGIFSMIPAIIFANVIGSINIVLEVFQVLLQTCFIMDGLRRSSNTKELRRIKPGREMVTFLVISNVALWIMQTFEVKSHGMQDNRYEFYGKELWTILGHMCLPLMMFYRFHASVCIGDIWKYAYEPPGH
uniref:Otopetrin-2 n=1 Tax=Anoplophora glabripennis TaxID=217634 RepID=V5I8B2_ANOGL